MSETDYVIRTPDRRHKTCVMCQLSSETDASISVKVLPVALASVLPSYSPWENDAKYSVLCARLHNSSG